MGTNDQAVIESYSPDVYNVLTKCYEAVIRAVVFLYKLIFMHLSPLYFSSYLLVPCSLNWLNMFKKANQSFCF